MGKYDTKKKRTAKPHIDYKDKISNNKKHQINCKILRAQIWKQEKITPLNMAATHTINMITRTS